MPQQEAAGCGALSALRRVSAWKRPEVYIGLLLLIAGLATADAARAPQKQVLGRAYVAAVLTYQTYGRPVSRKFIRCRFVPTCSEYSLEAVKRFGIGRGLALTVRRIAACNRSVAPGTADAVPSS